jgi:methyl-accepting chemotaxis protein
MIDCRNIAKGKDSGELIVSSEPISFLGGVDPKTGIVIDPNHELKGQSIKDKVLFIPGGKGSTVGSYVIFQMKKQSKVTSQSAMLQQNTRSTYRILIISIVMLILFIGSNMYLSRINSQQLEATMYLNQYRLGSKTLTAAVQSYAVTGDQTYYDNYMKELNEDKNRDIAWEGLQKDGLTDNEWALLNHIAEMSNGLVPLEEEAMDKAGSGDTQAAISYVFGEEYESTVQEITATTDNCINDIQARMAQKQNTLNLIMITTMVIFILCFLTIARKIVTTLTFAKQELLIPIVKVSEQMKVLAQGHFDSRLDLPEDDSEVGIMVQAVHFMNDNFTKMITEISEILGQMGQGNYRVEPTEEYVGDFVQIKDSMVKIITDSESLNDSEKEASGFCCFPILLKCTQIN